MVNLKINRLIWMIVFELFGESMSYGIGVLGCDYWCIGGFSKIFVVVDRESRMLFDLFIVDYYYV